MKIPTALRGAAAAAALQSTEKLLPAAISAVQQAQAALDLALEAGKDTAPYRQALQEALRQVQVIRAAIGEKQAQIDQRRQDRISSAAGAMTATAQDGINRLLAGYTFTIEEGLSQ